MITIIPCRDKYELESRAGDIISQSANGLLKGQKTVVLGIPGGRSVSGIFRRLRGKSIPWGKIHVFMVDERLVPLDDPQSNFKLAREHLIDELLTRGILPSANVHPFVVDESRPDFGLSNYLNELLRHGGIYDIVLLSSGEDGHVAALYPEHHSINDESRAYIVFHDSPKPPKDRMSISRKLLTKSRIAILLFEGEIKRAAYAKFQDKLTDFKLCPAKLVLSIRDSYVLTDLK